MIAHRRPSTLSALMLLGLAVLALPACAMTDSAPPTPEASAADLPEPIRTALQRFDIPPDAVSILVQDRRDGTPRLRHNAEVPRNPASVMKLFPTYAALELLGPAHTWETRIHAHGPIRDGVLHGDLWIEGGGDPFLTAEDFWKLVGAVRRRGIERIEGDLVVDGSRFGPVERDPGAFDDEPFRAYNQPPHALLVNFNTIEFELQAAQENQMVRVTMHPPLGNLPVENRLRLDPGAWCGGYRWHVDYKVQAQAQTPQAIFEGPFAKGCGVGRLVRTGIPVEDYVHGLFSALWRHWDGEFSGGWRSAEWPAPQAEPLARHYSRSLAEVVRLINKHSNNVMTRQLALTLAAEGSETPVTESEAREVLRTALTGLGVDIEGMAFDEVAGLSRTNRITVDHVASVLEQAANSLVMPEFVSSLPVAGVDGTLRNRLKDGPEAGRIRMKTGRIDHVSALAGYMRNAANEDLIVVILVNHEGAHRGPGPALQDEILRWAFREVS